MPARTCAEGGLGNPSVPPIGPARAELTFHPLQSLHEAGFDERPLFGSLHGPYRIVDGARPTYVDRARSGLSREDAVPCCNHRPRSFGAGILGGSPLEEGDVALGDQRVCIMLNPLVVVDGKDLS